MWWFTVTDIYQSIRPLYYPLKLFGLAVSPFNRSPARESRLLAWLYLFAFGALYTYIAYVWMYLNPFPSRYKSVILDGIEDLYTLMFYLLAVHGMLMFYLVRDKIGTILKAQYEVDLVLARLGTKVHHAKHHRQLMVAIAIVVAIAAGITAGYYRVFISFLNVDRFTLQRQVAYVIFMHNFELTVGSGTFLMHLLRQRFAALNDTLRMYFPTTPTSSGFLSVHTETTVCNEKEQLAVLKQIKILHDKLNDVVELVNYCFSVQITFCVGLCFVIGVVCSFGLFRAFIYRNELFYMGVLNFIWYMYYLFFVLFFIAVGSKITREGKRIGVLVHKAINCSTSSAVINELNIFSQQLLHRSPVITCGLFVYDWTLLYTMIGATATYLIILIQFDVSFPNLVNVNGTTATGSAGS
ncbi:uncharacterized protein LOC131685071 isoform X2 [Topomyia yanbarensis]|uniref:uncharacterized protein LOC131685071 isoform X2 n=1 Tax=Topomyia yanbarensis TaxID=2498891 RepID=UPI00273AEDDE|nr:uncharacterized protein LOC131685071 isoform X2 [Topomyia yanbarensis]